MLTRIKNWWAGRKLVQCIIDKTILGNLKWEYCDGKHITQYKNYKLLLECSGRVEYNFTILNIYVNGKRIRSYTGLRVEKLEEIVREILYWGSFKSREEAAVNFAKEICGD